MSLTTQSRFILASAVLLSLVATGSLVAAPDDVVEQERPHAKAVNRVVNFDVDANFDQWVFQGMRNGQGGRERVEARLDIQVAELDRLCSLSEAQKEKLRLAARGDISRFFDSVETLRAKFRAGQHDQNVINRMWQEIQPLQRQQAMGLFNEKSLFGGVTHKILDKDQREKYDKATKQRQKFRYRATIEVSMDTLEGIVPLKQSQRDAIIAQLVDNTPPALAFGQYDYMLVMYRLGSIADKHVKPILDERQWNLIRQQINQYRAIRSTLVQNGVIDADERY